MSLDKLHTWEKSIWQWRSGGLAFYDAGIVGLAAALCASTAFMSHLSFRKAMSALFNMRNVGLLLAVWALQLGLMSVHAALLKAYSPMPLAVAYIKPLQRWKQPVAHLSAAMGSLHAIQSTLAHLTTSAGVAWALLWCFMLLLHGKGLGAWGMWYGIVLGVLHGLLVIARGEDTLCFPIIHRQRLFRVKRELLQFQGLTDAGILSAASLAVAGLSQVLFNTSRGIPGVSTIAAALLSAALTAFCMRMGGAIANIITTEHLRFAAVGDADPNALLFAALQDRKRPVWQALALQDLTHLSQGGPSEQWRRAAIFDDESGASWSTVVQHCLGEVEAMVERTAAGLPQGSKPADKKAAFTPAWNIRSVSTRAFGGGKRAQEEALAYQRSRRWHATQSIRTLGGLCMASHAEDRLGTAQLAQPNLGAVTAVLASMVLAMQAFARTSGASGKGPNLDLAQKQSSPSGGIGRVEVPAFALQDAALTALYGLVGTFGRNLEPLVRGSSHKLPYGSASDAVTLLSRCSNLQE